MGEESIMGVTDEQISRVLNAVPKGLLIGGKWISTEGSVQGRGPRDRQDHRRGR